MASRGHSTVSPSPASTRGGFRSPSSCVAPRSHTGSRPGPEPALATGSLLLPLPALLPPESQALSSVHDLRTCSMTMTPSPTLQSPRAPLREPRLPRNAPRVPAGRGAARVPASLGPLPPRDGSLLLPALELPTVMSGSVTGLKTRLNQEEAELTPPDWGEAGLTPLHQTQNPSLRPGHTV